jgi:septum formation protein
MNIILASQSPRRKQLLEQAELSFVIRTAHSSEDFPADMPVDDVPLFIASNKALAVLDTLNPQEKAESVIIAADTVVELDEEIIGKPEDEADAMRILSRLSGRMHRVITGVSIRAGGRSIDLKTVTEVYFHEISAENIAHYVQQYKPMDKAGAYAIQEWIGLTGIEKINGDFYNVMGLPVSKVVSVLKKEGWC